MKDAPPRAGALGVAALATAVGLGAPPPGRADLRPEAIEARLLVGYDSNLLDASDAERAAFHTRNPGSYFVVGGMEDEFLEGALAAEWRPGHLWGRRPSLWLRYGRRQYLHNPIKSEDRYRIQARARVTGRTRLEAEGSFQPQLYGRHRFDHDAGPGEPLFRPEVHRRWDAALGATGSFAGGTELALKLEGSWRDYRAPFDERDRRAAGGRAGLSRAAGRHLRLGAVGGFRRAWGRAEPELHDDRSYREWMLDSWFEAREIPLLSTARVGVELEWRRFVTRDPEDEDHFGRDDGKGEVEVQVTRRLGASLVWTASVARRWRRADTPGTAFDDDDAFSESEARSGFSWSWAPAGGAP